jgi:hypothetical protein
MTLSVIYVIKLLAGTPYPYCQHSNRRWLQLLELMLRVPFLALIADMLHRLKIPYRSFKVTVKHIGNVITALGRLFVLHNSVLACLYQNMPSFSSSWSQSWS